MHLYALETMGPYFNRLLSLTGLSGNTRVWGLIVVEILFACLIAALIELLKKSMQQPSQCIITSDEGANGKNQRDTSVDIARGIFICSMLVGHFDLDSRLRAIIYSCHMMAFVFFSGYFYKKNRSISATVKRMLQTFLLPYLIFVVAFFFLYCLEWSPEYFRENIIRYLLGMSYSRRILPGIGSVGPVYFILLLFSVRLLYMSLEYFIKNRRILTAAVLLISVLGLILGQKGFWLPWSVNIACYALIFYHIGRFFRERDLLAVARNWHICYFILSPIWAYMIYMGSMEIAVRKYGDYGIVILGATAGIVLIYKLAVYIKEHIPICADVLRRIGEASIYIIIVHVLFRSVIENLVKPHFSEESFVFLVCSVLLQLLLSLASKAFIDFGKGLIKQYM